MKKIEAIIRREKFAEVDQALRDVGVEGLTMEDVTGRGRARVTITTYARGIWTNEEEFIKHIKLEIIVDDENAQKVVNAIMGSARTSSIGDGKIFVTTIDNVVDIGSGETGKKAILSETTPPIAVAPTV